MYRGYGFSRGKRTGKKVWRWICILILTAEIASIFGVLAIRALGATGAGAPGHMLLGKQLTWRLSKTIGSSLPGKLPKEPQGPCMPVIVLDPGHGGEEGGYFSEGVMETDVNFEIGTRVKEKLVKAGYRVIMAREDDIPIEKEKRAEMSNQERVYIYESGATSGIERNKGGDDPKHNGRLARIIHQEVLRNTGSGEMELLSDKEYQEQVAEGIVRGIDVYYHPKTMYLTFDDGPSAENTSAVLDILKARNIQATFFVVGENVRRNPELAKRIVREGHTIGIHCNRHEYDKVYESVDSYMRDFQEAYNAVLEVTGAEVKLYRFPGGSINAYNQNIYQDIIKEMTARGFTYFDWNASLEDSLKKTEPGELVANAKRTVMDRKNVVLLAHDVVHSTALCLDELIDQFPEYEMRPLTPDAEAVRFHP